MQVVCEYFMFNNSMFEVIYVLYTTEYRKIVWAAFSRAVRESLLMINFAVLDLEVI